jgi:hypothetical protein
MTQSILPRSDHRNPARTETTPEPPGRSRIIAGVRVSTGITAATGIACAAVSVASNSGLPALVVACAAFVMAVIGSSVLVVNALLPTYEEYYRRGYLEGWHQGWNGQPPENNTHGLV